MAYNEKLANMTRELIAAVEKNVTEKAMFGGLCFMVNDKMALGVEKERLMVRLDPVIYETVMEKLVDIDQWVSKTPNGFEVQAAWLQIRNKVQEQIIRTAREFGLTPAARSSVKVNKQQQLDLLGAEASTSNSNDPYRDYGLRN